MRKTRLPFAIVALFVFSHSASADVLAEAVWAKQSDNVWAIEYTSFDGESWSTPRKVHSSEEGITTPTISTDRTGGKLLVWSEWQAKQLVLKQKQLSLDSEDWSEATTIYQKGTENIAPSLLVDLEGSTWLFWCAEQGGQADIFSMKSAGNGNWGQVSKIHKDNLVPDLHPAARLNRKGDIEVSWNTYSVVLQNYVPETTTIRTDAEDDEKPSINNELMDFEDAINFAEVPLPPDLPSDSLSSIHSPQNLMIQSSSISASQGANPSRED